MDKELHCIIQYHNYRKEHFGKLIGVFNDRTATINIFNKTVEIYEKTCFSKNCKIINYDTNNDDIIKIILLKEDPDDIELMIFKIQTIKKNIEINNEKTYNIYLYYEFPVWVLNI